MLLSATALALRMASKNAYGDLGLAIGYSEKYGSSIAAGIYGERWGLEVGSAGTPEDTTQHPGGSVEKEPTRFGRHQTLPTGETFLP